MALLALLLHCLILRSPDKRPHPCLCASALGVAESLWHALKPAFDSRPVPISHLLEQCVPTIFWTTLVLFNSLLPWSTTIPLIYGPLKTDVVLNASFLTALAYAAYFVGLEPIAGCV